MYKKNQNNLVVYSASAGSGKTFSLVTEYISMILDKFSLYGSTYYRNILAITFTKAATKEMKERVLDVLTWLSERKDDKDDCKGYMPEIVRKTRKSPKEISESSGKILKDILHNYSFFNISTIDSFFSKVLNNLSRELGIEGDLSVIIKDEEYNKKAVDRVLSLSEEDSDQGRLLRYWLMAFFRKKQDEGKGWKLEKDLNDAVESLQKENKTIELLDHKLCKTDKLKTIAKNLKERKEKLDKKAEELKETFISLCKDYGLEEDHFKWEKNGLYAKAEKYYPQWKKGGVASFCDLCDKVEHNYNDLVNGDATISEDLRNHIKKMYNFENEHRVEYLDSDLIYKNIHTLGISKQLYTEKNNALKDDHVFVLSDTKKILNALSLKDSEASSDMISFIYEKIGSHIKSIMIDEFQDTSLLDWNNLQALQSECLSKGGKAFVFGDIKQSIYRFNNGDWHILDNLTKQEENTVVSLDKNFRTFGNIVEFNNLLFKDIYENFPKQKIKPGYENKGSVSVTFADSEAEVLNRLEDEIKKCFLSGYKPKDIAILCRDKNSIEVITSFLKEKDRLREEAIQAGDFPAVKYRYNPTSDDAFELGSSDAVTLLVSTLQYLYNKDNEIASQAVLYNDFKQTDPKNKQDIENSLDKEAVKKIDKMREKDIYNLSLMENAIEIANILHLEDSVYLPAFYDYLRAFICSHKSTPEEFFDYWESTLKTQKIVMGTNEDSIRVTTIHKSKGLEYNVVIVPIRNNKTWEFFKSKAEIWVNNEQKNYKDMDLPPVFRTQVGVLKDSSFNDEYEKEKEAQRSDNFNLLYVAFTRAKKHLRFISIRVKEAGSLNAARIIEDRILEMYSKRNFTEEVRNHYTTYRYKKWSIIQDDQDQDEKQEGNKLELSMSFSPNALKFACTEKSKEYFSGKEREQSLSKREFGIEMHKILSKIKTRQDIEQNSALWKQYFQDYDTIEILLKAMMDHCKDRLWFDGSFKVLNEKNILTQGKEKLNIRRPDRIMFKDDRVEIVDYKFAEFDQKTHQNHVKQIEEYKELLKKMGYSNISSHIWYINHKEDSVEQEIITVE